VATVALDIYEATKAIESYSSTYADAREGTDNFDTHTDDLRCGQSKVLFKYSCFQFRVAINISAIPSIAVLSDFVITIQAAGIGFSGSWRLNAYVAGWASDPSAFLGANSWYAGSVLAAEDPFAYISDVSAMSTNTDTDMTVTTEGLNLVKNPEDREAFADTPYMLLILASANQASATAPSGVEYFDFRGRYSDAEGEYSDYKMTFTVEADTELGYYSSNMSFLAEAEAECRCRLRANLDRPIGSELRAYDHSKTFQGILPADVDVTQRLDGAYQLSALIPWQYGKADGTSESRADMITGGWYVEYGGRWYVVQDFTEDMYANKLPITAVSSETELEDFLTNYSQVPFSMPSHTPTEIMDAILGGLPECAWYNGDFTELDSDGFPVGWIDNTGTWSAYSGLGGPGVACTACDGGSAELESFGINHTAGAQIKPKFDFYVEDGFSGIIKAVLSWTNASGVESAYEELEASYITTGGWTSYEAPDWIDVLNEKCVLKFQISNNSDDYDVRFRDVRFVQNEDDTGWSYAGSMDTREPELAYNDPAIQLYGNWTQDHVNELVHSETVGDVLGRVFTGDQITVAFAAGGAGAKADVKIDGVTVIAGLSVATATSYSVEDLNRYRSHVLEVVVNAVKVSISGLTISSENRIPVTWNRLTVYDALRELQNLVGGEYYFDTVTQTIYHDLAQGDDLTAASVLWLREGQNLLSFVPETTSQVHNRLYYGGHGDGAFQLGLRVDSTDTNDDGDTSQTLYGVRRFAHTNKDVKDLASAWAEALREVEKNAFQTKTYRASVRDTDAALMIPGDSVQVTHQLIGTQTLRVLEIIRHSNGNPAHLLLGQRTLVMDAAAQSEAVRRKVDQLLRTY
jgi:hypothetical protein